MDTILTELGINGANNTNGIFKPGQRLKPSDL